VDILFSSGKTQNPTTTPFWFLIISSSILSVFHFFLRVYSLSLTLSLSLSLFVSVLLHFQNPPKCVIYDTTASNDSPTPRPRPNMKLKRKTPSQLQSLQQLYSGTNHFSISSLFFSFNPSIQFFYIIYFTQINFSFPNQILLSILTYSLMYTYICRE
jgi:Na+/melibiose symporter-like transporter